MKRDQKIGCAIAGIAAVVFLFLCVIGFLWIGGEMAAVTYEPSGNNKWGVSVAIEGFKYQPVGCYGNWGRVAFKLSTVGPANPKCTFKVKWLDADDFVIDEAIAQGGVPGLITAESHIRREQYVQIKKALPELLYCD